MKLLLLALALQSQSIPSNSVVSMDEQGKMIFVAPTFPTSNLFGDNATTLPVLSFEDYSKPIIVEEPVTRKVYKCPYGGFLYTVLWEQAPESDLEFHSSWVDDKPHPATVCVKHQPQTCQPLIEPSNSTIFFTSHPVAVSNSVDSNYSNEVKCTSGIAIDEPTCLRQLSLKTGSK